jgi:subtilisin family serine protease
VLYAEPNFIVRVSTLPPNLPRRIPNDFDFGVQYGLQNTNTYFGKTGADIAAPQAWMFTTGNRKVCVAVIDTGIDYFHPDLRANVWINSRESFDKFIRSEVERYGKIVRTLNIKID